MQPTTGNVHFQRGLWRETAYRYGENKWLIAMIVAVFAGLYAFDKLDIHTSAGSLSSFVWAILAISVHSVILNGKSSFPSDKRPFWPFFWRSMVLSIPGFVICVAAVIAYPALLEPETRFILLTVPLYGIPSALSLGFLGTWLPAVIARDGDKSLAAAAKRGKSVFGYTILRLLGGCGLTGLIMVIITGALSTLGFLMGLDVAPKNGLVPYALLVQVLLYAMLSFMFVMIPVILSRAYLIAEARHAKVASFGAASVPPEQFSPKAQQRDLYDPAQGGYIAGL